METNQRKVGRPKAPARTGPLVLGEDYARTKVTLEISERDHLPRGRISARPRVVQDDGRPLREARGGGGCAAETGARGAHRRAAGVVSGNLLNTYGVRRQSFPNRSLNRTFNPN